MKVSSLISEVSMQEDRHYKQVIAAEVVASYLKYDLLCIYFKGMWGLSNVQTN